MQYVYLIIGLVVGFWVGYLIKGKSFRSSASNNNIRMSAAEREKAGNIEKIKTYISDHSSVTNAEVAKILGVSDATVVRYMDELETSGIVKQVGKTGVDAHYEKTN